MRIRSGESTIRTWRKSRWWSLTSRSRMIRCSELKSLAEPVCRRLRVHEQGAIEDLRDGVVELLM